MELFQNTIYINLEHRKDRLEHITKQLENLGIQAERFNAVRTKDGAVGCSMSHIKCLELAKSRDYEYTFICEDDITFLNPDVLKDSLAKFYENKELFFFILLLEIFFRINSWIDEIRFLNF